MEWWVYFLLGMAAALFIQLLLKEINRLVIEYRRNRFLKMVKVEFPHQNSIRFITVDTTDKRAMAKMERQLREQFDISEEPEFEEDTVPRLTE